jgi:hypothetical protein
MMMLNKQLALGSWCLLIVVLQWTGDIVLNFFGFVLFYRYRLHFGTENFSFKNYMNYFFVYWRINISLDLEKLNYTLECAALLSYGVMITL